MTQGFDADVHRRISDAFERDGRRLRNWLRRHVSDRADAEDILQDAFYELVQAYRLLEPVENVGAWLFRVARNRVTDRFRRKAPDALADQVIVMPDGDVFALEDLLPSPEAGPEAAYARSVLIEELAEALEELPAVQRAVFLAHEVQGLSFRDISAVTGAPVNTLLSRKHAAVLYLRCRLQDIYLDFRDEAST